MEGERSVTPTIIDELHSWYIQGDQMEGERMVLLEVSLMNFLLRISNEVEWKVQVVGLEISLMDLILPISKEIK